MHLVSFKSDILLWLNWLSREKPWFYIVLKCVSRSPLIDWLNNFYFFFFFFLPRESRKQNLRFEDFSSFIHLFLLLLSTHFVFARIGDIDSNVVINVPKVARDIQDKHAARFLRLSFENGMIDFTLNSYRKIFLCSPFI